MGSNGGRDVTEWRLASSFVGGGGGTMVCDDTYWARKDILMARRISRVLGALALALLLCLGTAACGKKESQQGEAQPQNPSQAQAQEEQPSAPASVDLTGYYQVRSIRTPNETISEQDMEAMREWGMDILLALKEGGKGEYNHYGEVLEATWATDDSGTTTVEIDGVLYEATVDGDVLTLEGADKGAITFALVDEQAYEDALAAMEQSSESLADSIDEFGDSGEYDESLVIAPVTIGQTVADDSLVTITIESKSQNGWGDPGFEITFTNNSDQEVFIAPQYGTFTVNGNAIDPQIFDFAASGETISTFMWFEHTDLGGGLDAMSDVHGTLEIQDAETFEVIATYEFDA